VFAGVRGIFHREGAKGAKEEIAFGFTSRPWRLRGGKSSWVLASVNK
jgi:hypothetical protein